VRLGAPLAGLGTVGRSEPLMRLGQQRLALFPAPLGPITDDAPAPRRCRNPAGLWARREGRAEWRLMLPLLPTAPRDEARTIPQGAAAPLRVTPLAPPPRPPRALASPPVAGYAGPGGPGRHLRPITAQAQHRPAQTTRGHLGKAPLDLLA
jgi:hypothetical protein